MSMLKHVRFSSPASVEEGDSEGMEGKVVVIRSVWEGFRLSPQLTVETTHCNFSLPHFVGPLPRRSGGGEIDVRFGA